MNRDGFRAAYSCYGILDRAPFGKDPDIALIQDIIVKKSWQKEEPKHRWKTPGGKQDPGETSPEATLFREMEEEVPDVKGHDLIVGSRLGEPISIPNDGRDPHLFFGFRLGFTDTLPEELTLGHEVYRVQWTPGREIVELTKRGLVLDNHATILQRYFNEIGWRM